MSEPWAALKALIYFILKTSIPNTKKVTLYKSFKMIMITTVKRLKITSEYYNVFHVHKPWLKISC